jgi:transcriptional regulator with XRE-family HTH domain
MPKRPEQPTGFAGLLKRLRQASGLTQGQLADRAGFHGFTVAKLEQGLQEPTWPTVLALAAALGVNCLAFVAEGRGEQAEARRPGRPRKATGALPTEALEAEQAKPPARTGKGRRPNGK